MDNYEANITIGSDEELYITRKYKGRCEIKFNLIGKVDHRNSDSIDGRMAYTQSTKSELFVLELVDERMCKSSNRITILMKGFNKSEKERIKTGTRKLIQRGLLIRIKKEHYMVSPWFFVPQRTDQSEALHQWNKHKAARILLLQSSSV